MSIGEGERFAGRGGFGEVVSWVLMCDLKQGMEQLGTWLVWVVLMDCCDELSYFTVWTFVFGVLIVANLTDGHGGFVYGEVEMLVVEEKSLNL